MAMRTGTRVFGGKRFSFFMFADTRGEAESHAARFIEREREKFGKRGYYRITEGVAPRWHRGKVRYSIWVREVKIKKKPRR